MTGVVTGCACGSDDPAGCLFLNAGYPWCTVCEDHHRPPDCPVDGEGYALAPCGCRWRDVDEGGHRCDETDTVA